MRISVISPVPHGGTTTASMFLAQSLAHTQSLSVMLTYTGTNRRLCEYMGVSSMDDKTRSISQVVKLMESRAIGPEDLYDYSLKLYPNMNIMDTADPTLSDEDNAKLISYVFKNIKSDICICDISDEIYSETTQELFEVSDIVAIVIQPDRYSYDMFRRWRESEYWPKKANIMVIVNNYNEEVAALRDISKQLGIPHVNVCKIHYNPYIMKYSNTGESLTMMPYVVQRDPRVIELNTDFKEMTQYVVSNLGIRFKWEV